MTYQAPLSNVQDTLDDYQTVNINKAEDFKPVGGKITFRDSINYRYTRPVDTTGATFECEEDASSDQTSEQQRNQ